MKKRFLWLLLASLFLNFFDRVVGLGPVKSILHQVAAPIQVGMVRSRIAVQDGLTFVYSLPFVYRQNLKLKEELVGIQGVQLENAVLKIENQVLRQQFNAIMVSSENLTPARVLGFFQQADETLVIVQGEFNLGRSVILGDSLVGEVVYSGGNVSRVRTVFSPQSRVAVNVLAKEGTVEAIAEGRFMNEIYLTKILSDQEVFPGELVVTSGIAGKFQKNCLIGEIEAVFEDSDGVFKSARVSAKWMLKELNVVLITN
ncbi:rod shape-determining protein MreC [Patescibacteria group bacterium]|nr:rod shape-determining protein MreC [Patescibacteria group bacterium]MBU1867976.1 rod shape-determining protein MreC [Patescibacteria group bacterium]